MQNGEPAWHGYVYAGCILLGQLGGVMSEGIYFQSVMRVGFHVRQAMVGHKHTTIQYTTVLYYTAVLYCNAFLHCSAQFPVFHVSTAVQLPVV